MRGAPHHTCVYVCALAGTQLNIPVGRRSAMIQPSLAEFQSSSSSLQVMIISRGVSGHLKRLGGVVVRFIISAGVTTGVGVAEVGTGVGVEDVGGAAGGGLITNPESSSCLSSSAALQKEKKDISVGHRPEIYSPPRSRASLSRALSKAVSRNLLRLRTQEAHEQVFLLPNSRRRDPSDERLARANKLQPPLLPHGTLLFRKRCRHRNVRLRLRWKGY